MPNLKYISQSAVHEIEIKPLMYVVLKKEKG
jgi:hypothetical protein